MTEPPAPALVQSLLARLRNLAAADGAGFQTLLERFAVERLLYRISSSPMRESFVLKGATVFLAWGGEAHRPSRDLDMLGFGLNGVEDLVETFREITALPVEPDGLVFPAEAIKGSRIKEGHEYEGVRLVMLALLGKVRIPVQVDIGFGDAVEPAPIEGDFPTLLDLPAPRLRLYPREVVVAEKFQALVSLGVVNTRLKDFYDLWILSRTFDFDGDILCGSLRATFARRGTPLPEGPPAALSSAFGHQAQPRWQSFLRKGQLAEIDLVETLLPALAEFLLPAARAARTPGDSPGAWSKGGPWQ
jgi:predicted nucleotidyltransferase component of viral defense system